MSDLQSKINQIGLTQVYASPDPKVDIVFVHGLNGHPYSTWTSKSGSSVFWPAELLPDILASKQVRILTYGYNASVHAFTDGASNDRIHHHAETLASSLAANRSLRECSDRPIIFVCHSLGGLVVKRTLIHCENVSSEKIEHLRSIYVSAYGILFLGTPHNGSDIAKWGVLLQNICSAVLPKRFMETSPHLIGALRTNNETLQNINSLFAEMMGRYHIYYFHETRSTNVKGSRELIVDESSAAPYVEGVERMGIEADHSTMCKFDGENSPGYEAVAEALLRYSRDAPATISARWLEEKNTRAIRKKAKAKEIFDDSVDGPTGGSMPDLRMIGSPTGPLERLSPTSSMAHSTELVSSRHSQREPLFVVPPGFHPNATFVGMKRELETLHTRLFRAKKRAERLMAVLICGVPGSGKTHLARQYVWTRRDSYPGGIFWVDAKSSQSRYKCFWDIAQAATLIDGKEFEHPDSKAPHKYVDAVRDWFQSREEWLLIFDGLSFDQEDDLNHLKQFLPFNKKCSIIYTSVDKTLRKKQRLFEPYCLQIPPLSVEDACKLLFKDLGIRRPSQDQGRKAAELVTHYAGLPLAIHAISHRLNATSKSIEKYHIHSHLTDEKLAEPFLGIMHDLYRMEHFEALNLINIMSFLGHHIPVGLINLGRAVLETWGVGILTPTRPGAHGDIDTTLGILIRCGLIERTTDSYTLYPRSTPQRSDDDSVDLKALTPDLSESQTESSQDAFFSVSQSSRTIDVIRIHSVVQGFCRDELKIMDEERAVAFPGSTDAGFYDSWLAVVTRVLCKSYENARNKMGHDYPLVKDYREYETHASRLLEHFPKRTSGTPRLLCEARRELRQTLSSIAYEIDRISPSSSQESIQKQRSVFDRSSSSSSSVPGSSTDEGPSRQLTWDWSDAVSSKVESPDEIAVPPHCFNLTPFPPHIYRESTLGKDDGYESDKEGPKSVVRISPALSQMSQATEKPRSSPASSPPQMDEAEWHLVEKPSKSKSGKEKQNRPKRKLRRDFRTPKPAVPMLNVFQVAGKGASSHNLSSSRSSSFGSSEAEKRLTAMHKASPPQSRGENAKPADYSTFGKENVPSYATVAAGRLQSQDQGWPSQRSISLPSGQGRVLGQELQTKSSGESLHSRISNPQPSCLSAEFKPDELSQSVHSEPNQDFLRPQLNVPDSRTVPGTRYHSRHPSAIGQPVGDLAASAPSLVPYYPAPLPYDEDISITFSHRRLGSSPMTVPVHQPVSSISPSAHPSAIMPGVSPPHSYTAEVPGGYSSDPVMSEPMSRGPSTQSWSTEPAQHMPRISPIPSSQGMMHSPPPNNLDQFDPRHHLISGTGRWIGDAHGESGLLRPAPLDNQLGLLYGLNPDPQQAMQFTARERLVGYSRYPVPQQAAVYNPEMAIPPHGALPMRARSGSSPVHPSRVSKGRLS